ncbi:hypothetical protein FSP39_009196 [Pinctada imbricata]|uniref:B box-type domain-containing protein n=1 Tax=Pinctada imbricata TaxID=66713 RepID=A0AA89CA99_PINIB|nr:hypothetical protein FSP39_009196 [Pinctada imbricata]
MASSMSSLYKAQFALRLCEYHDKKDLHAYCKTCEKKYCSICIKEDHNQHDWETITDILREKRRSLPVECTKLRTTKLKDLKNEIDRFDRKIQTEDVRFKRNKSVLNSSRKSYIDNINKLFDYKIEVCRQKSEEAIQMYSEERDGLKRVVEHIEIMTTALDKDIKTIPDHDILDMEKEMKDELEKALSYSAYKYVCTTVFVPGVMDVQALENMIGELHSVSVEEMYDIDRNSDALQLVKPVS